MRSGVRRILIVIAAVAVVAVAVIAILLRSLQDGDLRAGVEARLSAALGQPVAIGHIGISLFPPSLTGSDVRVGEARVQAPAVQIDRIHIRPRLRSLVSGDIVLEDLTLQGFIVSVLRDETGGWHVPATGAAPSGSVGPGPTVERVGISKGRIRVFEDLRAGDMREVASIDDLDAEVRVAGGGLTLSPITARIGRADISGKASTDAAAVSLDFEAKAIADDDLPVFLRLLGSDRPVFLRLDEAASAAVALRVDRATSQLLGKGTLSAPRMTLEPLKIERFEAPFAIRGSRVVFQPTRFGMYGGTHEGDVAVELSESPPAWIANSEIRGLDAGDFLTALAGRDQRVDGTASLAAALRGRVGEPLDRSVAGRMRLTVTDGVIRNFPLLATINRGVRLAERDEGDTRFEQLSGTFAIAAGQATTDDLILQAAHVRAALKGRLGADRSLALRGSVVISAERSAQAVASIRELARLRNGRGELELPLTISGSLDAPAFGLDVESAIKKGVTDELQRQLRRLIRR